MIERVETPEEKQLREERQAKDAAIMAARLKDERVMIFANLMNGVPEWKIAEQFHKSVPDVMHIFRFILRKIRSRRLERMEPPIVGNSLAEIRRQRITVLTLLPRLNLDKEPHYSNVMHEGMEVKQDGTVRNADFLRQLKPMPEHLRIPPGLKS
jgi:hypothetical protein